MVAGVVGVLVAAGCSAGQPPPRLAPSPPAASAPATASPTGPSGEASAGAAEEPSPDGVAVLVGAGDIADCGSGGDEATAALLDRIPGTVATFGDNAYPDGSPGDFARCYDPSWGRHRDRTRPAPGNHDYATAGAAGYFGYFGAAAGRPGEGWYAYDLGAHWRAVVLNSNCWAVGGCGPGSPQERWLRRELARHADRHVLAYWHHPRWSSGRVHGGDDATAALWAALDDGGAALVLTGHEHVYERLAPVDPAGRPDPDGIRQFVVGTGGRSLYGFGRPLPASEVRDAATFGVLVLQLYPDRYAWEFVATEPGGFTDSGVQRLGSHRTTPAPAG